MKFQVIWTEDAESDLADLWLRALDRNTVSRASLEIDRTLKFNADQQGESREGNMRVLFCRPLAVNFVVHRDDATAYVIAVWRIGRRN